MRSASTVTTRVVMIVLAVVALLPLVRLLAGGLWEPWELHRAEAARQVAAGEVPAWSVPEVEGEGERPPLATWVTALGFSLGGDEVGNGKIAVAFFLLACVLAALLVLRPFLTLERALAGFAVFFALPLVFFQGASAGGDGVAFGAYAVAFAGLTRLFTAPGTGHGAAAERRDLLVGLLASAVGLALCYFALGAVLGLMVPLGAGAIATAIGGGMRARGSAGGKESTAALVPTIRWVAAAVAAGLFVWFVVAGLLHKPVEESERFTLAIGGLKILNPLETFDLLLSRYAYTLFPWCALVPLALAWVVMPRDGDEAADAPEAEPDDKVLGRHAAVHMLLGYGLLAYWSWRYYPAPAIFVFPLALLVGDYLLDAMRQGRGLRLAGAVTAIFTVLVLRDAFAFQKDFLALIGFPKPGEVVTETPAFPMTLALAAGLFIVLVLFTHLVPPADEPEPAFDWYRRQVRSWSEAWRTLLAGGPGGRLAALAVLLPWVGGALLWVAVIVAVLLARYTDLTRFTVSHLGFKAVLLGIGGGPLLVGLADVAWRAARKFIAAAGPTVRGAMVMSGGLSVSLVAGLAVAPSLDAQFSLEPAARAAAAEGNLTGRLVLLQVEPAATRYYPSLAPGKIMANVDEAVNWLADAPAGKPRFLVFPSRNAVLNEVNQKFRDRRNGALLPVISDPAGRYMLAVSELAANEPNRSPLARVILLQRPHPRYPVLEGNFDNKVKYLGYDITSYPDGTVAALQNVTITHYWECLATLTGDYEVFVHVDGMGDRINGDHDPAEGLFPTRYWRPGDIIVDRQQLRIPFFVRPSARPDAYQMYLGLFRGESRLPLVEGEGNDNRLYGGVLRVR
jgi:hypothetical protein